MPKFSYLLVILISSQFLTGCKLSFDYRPTEGEQTIDLSQGQKTQLALNSEGTLRLDTQGNNLSQTSFDKAQVFGATFTSAGKIQFGRYETAAHITAYTQLDLDMIFAIEYDEASGILWLCDSKYDYQLATSPIRIHVIDTKKTKSFADDIVIGVYDSTLFPQLGTIQNPRELVYDSADKLLYVTAAGMWRNGLPNTSSGVLVINTQGTTSLSDDAVVGKIDAGLFPAYINWNISTIDVSSELDCIFIGVNYIYGHASYRQLTGVYVIKRNGTISLADDTVEQVYNEYSTLVVNGVSFNQVQYDDETGFLFIGSTSAGALSVIDTKKTVSTADDTIAFKYTGSSNPAIFSHGVGSFYYDSVSGYIFINTNDSYNVNSRVVAIDTKKTASILDDVQTSQFKVHGTLLTINSPWQNVRYSSTDKKLYSNNSAGLHIFSLNDLANPADDELERFPEAASWNLGSVNATENFVFVASFMGLHVFDVGAAVNIQSSFTTEPMDILTSPMVPRLLSLDSTVTDLTRVRVQYQLGGADSYWIDNFDDNLTANITDKYSWGLMPTTISESSGTLKVSGHPSNWPYFWVESGKPANHFPKNSVIKVRYRANTNVNGLILWIYDDGDWYTDFTDVMTPNQWKLAHYTVDRGISDVGFDYDSRPSSGWVHATDTLELDWLSIDGGPALWDAWQDLDLDNGMFSLGSINTTGKKWIKFKVSISGSETLERVNGYSVSEGYHTSGSAIYSVNKLDIVNALQVDATMPAGTSYSFEVSGDAGTTWTNITMDTNTGLGKLPDGLPQNILLKVTLNSSSDLAKSPRINSIKLITQL